MEENKNAGSGKHKGKGLSGKGKEWGSHFSNKRAKDSFFSNQNKLAIHIDKQWKAYDFINIIEVIFFNYNLILFSLILEKYKSKLQDNIFNFHKLFSELDKEIEIELKQNLYNFTENPTSPNLHDIIKYLPDEFQISIVKVRYNSPGSLDFLGIGEVIKQVKEFLISLTTLKSDYELKKLEIEEKKEKIREQKIKNLNSTLEILNKYNFSNELITDISNQIGVDSKIVKELSEEEKITKIEMK